MTEPCPGPIPATTPRLKAPPGACDTHAHILGPYDRFALNQDRSYTAPEAPLEDFLVLLETLGLERAVIVHPSAHGTVLDVTEDAVPPPGLQEHRQSAAGCLDWIARQLLGASP